MTPTPSNIAMRLASWAGYAIAFVAIIGSLLLLAAVIARAILWVLT